MNKLSIQSYSIYENNKKLELIWEIRINIELILFIINNLFLLLLLILNIDYFKIYF